ncbi:hypothetical protein H5410_064000 [Solanum commersonii]|uniref:Uncharacterized protein n=1 Tax=Solanum commersonii TaxID=4109 RepID=A0A9J5W0T1_SOLCO|nr:hypothetical protein H5410_064000 [Solanum commersonii]
MRYLLRPKPLGRGHVAWASRIASPPARRKARRGGGSWPPVRPERAAGLNASPRRRTSRQVVVEAQLSLVVAATARRAPGLPDPDCAPPCALRPRPLCQAGLPAEV